MKTILDLRKELDEKKVTSEELFKEANSKAHKYQDEFNSFVTIIDEYLSLIHISEPTRRP